jgi:hypothetical protein
VGGAIEGREGRGSAWLVMLVCVRLYAVSCGAVVGLAATALDVDA